MTPIQSSEDIRGRQDISNPTANNAISGLTELGLLEEITRAHPQPRLCVLAVSLAAQSGHRRVAAPAERTTPNAPAIIPP